MMEDGRYTRRMVVAHMIWNPVKVTVEDHNTSLYIHDTKRTTLTVQRHALYRKLTDGSLQPVSGSRIVGTTDKRNVGYTQEYPISIYTKRVFLGIAHISFICSSYNSTTTDRLQATIR